MMVSQIGIVLIMNETKKIQTIIYLQEDHIYFQQEMKYIMEMKQKLIQQPESMTTIEKYISGKYPEYIILYLSIEGNQIIDYETIRY